MELWEQFNNNFTFKKMFFSSKGFTLMELIVVIAITAVLSAMIMFATTQYINRGKDSNIAGNMAILIPAGEVWYNGNSNNYSGFCDPTTPNGNSVLRNSILQMPQNASGYCSWVPSPGSPPNYFLWGTSGTGTYKGNPAGVCCFVNPTGDAWVAYVKEFADTTHIYCIDSRGQKEDIPAINYDTDCPDSILCIKTNFQCP